MSTTGALSAAIQAAIRNWSERYEPGGGSWRDCAYASWLTCLVAAGKRSFPLGIFTVAEREALERSDDRADETGATPADVILASKRRYGITPHVFEITSTASLEAALRVPGRAFSLAGQYRADLFPDGDPIRRWQKTYTGPHQATAVTLDGANVLWLDPLAPMGFAGDVIPVAKAARFAWRDYTALYIGVGELGPVVPDTATSGGNDMGLVTYKAENWHNGSAPADVFEIVRGPKWSERINPGAAMVTIGEAPDGSWRIVGIGQREINGVPVPDKLAIVMREPIVPDKQGGDPAFDALVGGTLYGHAPATGFTQDDINDATAAGRKSGLTAGADAVLEAAKKAAAPFGAS